MVGYSRFEVRVPGMKVLVVHEPTGKVREAFRALGNNAFSVDKKKSQIPSEYHLIYDANKLMYPCMHYDLIVSFVRLSGLFYAAPRVALIHGPRDMELKGLKPLDFTGKRGMAETMAKQWGDWKNGQDSESTLGPKAEVGIGRSREWRSPEFGGQEVLPRRPG